jgi:hypothetical protein
MYAYGKVIIERPKVRALPTGALARVGDKTFCFCYENGKAVRTEIQTGLNDTKNKWVEVTNRRRSVSESGIHKVSFAKPADAVSAMEAEDGSWVPFDGSEQVILGDLSILTDGDRVHVADASSEGKTAGDASGI